jgi:23S rRNA pseudouridine1911/1915/1917 synthase
MKTNVNYHNDNNNYNNYVVNNESQLLDWLIENIKDESKTKIKATLQGRGIKVDGKTVTHFDFQLKPGMNISVSKTKFKDQFKSRYVKIVYEDRYLIVIEKEIGILSMAAGHSSLNVKTVLDDYLKKSRQHCTAHVVHRLDRDTSGLMIYAKDINTEQILEKNWHDIVYDRRYVAIVSGEMEEDEGTIANWLKDNKAYVTYSSPTDNGGKYAVTHYHTLNRTTDYSLVEYKLETGRKNQIRVHSADMGHPVCGDVKYGDGTDPIHRLCLHAYLLCFYHPITHKPMEFETPIPVAFRRLFK